MKAFHIYVLGVVLSSLGLLVSGGCYSFRGIDAGTLWLRDLHQGIAISDHGKVRGLLLQRRDLINSEFNGRYALGLAAHIGDLQTAALLVDFGAYIDQRDVNGFTPLMEAVSSKKVEIVKLLIDRGANVHALYQGASVLALAEKASSVEIISLLRTAGAFTLHHPVSPEGSR